MYESLSNRISLKKVVPSTFMLLLRVGPYPPLKLACFQKELVLKFLFLDSVCS